ncbi:MAG: CbtA family protein, partial [Thermohalobaculum sp.]|nr:CbtA family protein [Thermohalobaculum sp.]
LYESGTLTHFAAGTPAAHDLAPGGAGPDLAPSGAGLDLAPSGAGHDHLPGQAHDDGHAHDDGASGGIGRALLTILSTVATYTGFALVVVAGFALAEGAGLVRITARQGLAWGLAGFAATQFFPALGLAPELPGSGAAALEARQVWWLMTAALTLAGIGVLAAVKSPLRFGGLVLLAIPHLIGAPHPEGYAGVTPPELAAHFAARALVVGAIGWVVLGWIAGLLWSRETAG